MQKLYDLPNQGERVRGVEKLMTFCKFDLSLNLQFTILSTYLQENQVKPLSMLRLILLNKPLYVPVLGCHVDIDRCMQIIQQTEAKYGHC